MKPVLILTIILTGIFVISIAPYSFAHVHPEHNFMVITNDRSYEIEDTITITVKASEYDGNNTVEIQIWKDGDIYGIAQGGFPGCCIGDDVNYIYTTSAIERKLSSGSYMVRASWGGNIAETTFTIKDSRPDNQTQIDPPSFQIEVGPADTSVQKIPEWVRNIFIWYTEKKVSEGELLNAIKYLVQQEIIKIDS